MKIGLLTLMNPFNYGGLLQCFSLCRALETFGHKVTVLDYSQSSRWRLVRRGIYGTGYSIGKTIERKIEEQRYGRELYHKFVEFREHQLDLSKPCNSDADLRQVSRNFDALLVGSDQVWNLDWFVPAYFLNFAQNYPGKKISYAACFGHRPEEIEHQDQIGAWLKNFHCLTVRNTMSQELVKAVSNRDSQIVADPTLLCELDDLAIMPDVPFDQYILLYALSYRRLRKILPVLAHFSKRFGLPCVAIKSDVLQPWAIPGIDHLIHNPSVGEWLGLFNHASYIITDSFHGTLYAVKNRKPFLNYIGSDASMERIAYIVERYGLQAGYPTDPYKAFESPFEYSRIRKDVETHVAESKLFLESL